MKIIVIAAMILVTTASCKKFLEEQAQNEIKPKTTASFQELLNGEGYFSHNDNLTAALTYLEDDVEFWYHPTYSEGQYYKEGRRPYEKYYMWQPFMDDATLDQDRYNIWTNLYDKIKACNIVLDNATVMTGPDRDRNFLQGQALALRSFYYFLLANLYAKPYNAPGIQRDQEPGIPLKLDSYVRDENLPRKSLQQTYDQIRKDIETAIPLLEQNGPAEHAYQFTALAAHLLASRIYLYTEEWNKAIPHADWVLERRPALDAVGAQTAAPGNWPVFDRTRKEVIWYFSNVSDFTDMVSLKVQGVEIPVFGPSPSLIGLYETGDKRKDYYFVPIRIAADPTIQGALRSGKTLELKRAFGRGFRVCEAYLNRAEANIQLVRAGQAGGSLDKAKQDLNTVRASRFTAAAYQDVNIADADQLFSFYKDERRREFCFETNRWFDLRRFGMPSISHGYVDEGGNRNTYVLQANDPGYVLPIPPIVIQRDNSVTQNPLAPVRTAQ